MKSVRPRIWLIGAVVIPVVHMVLAGIQVGR
jgi:hypothetical protein